MLLPDNLTQLVLDWANGVPAAMDKLLLFVKSERRRPAYHYMRRERRDHTLQTTALENEAYIRLVNQKEVHGQNRVENLSLHAWSGSGFLLSAAKEGDKL